MGWRVRGGDGWVTIDLSQLFTNHAEYRDVLCLLMFTVAHYNDANIHDEVKNCFSRQPSFGFIKQNKCPRRACQGKVKDKLSHSMQCNFSQSNCITF